MRPIAALYARVSTPEQAQKYSLSSQLRAMRRWAADHGCEVGFTLIEVYSTKTLNRPELKKLRALVTRGLIQVVICYDFDRLVRGGADSEELLDEFDNHGVKLRIVYDPLAVLFGNAFGSAS